MYCLKNDGMPQSVNQLFGLKSKSKSYLTWCDTRAQKLLINDSISLYQKDKDWFALVGEQESKLNAIAMETWFSKYCRLSVHFTDERPKGTMYSNQLDIRFVNGSQASFMRGQGVNIFKWRNRYFESPQLQKALSDLNKIIK